MAHAENEIMISRPGAEVYAFLADGVNNPTWRSGVRSIALAAGQFRATMRSQLLYRGKNWPFG